MYITFHIHKGLHRIEAVQKQGFSCLQYCGVSQHFSSYEAKCKHWNITTLKNRRALQDVLFRPMCNSILTYTLYLSLPMPFLGRCLGVGYRVPYVRHRRHVCCLLYTSTTCFYTI